jgi:transcriptional regulator of acetoin/glycerol metabolism
MQLLLRHNWPGNTEQLWQVLKQIVQRRRAGVIMPRDLPPECWTVSRRLLSPLESIERDAIVQSLQDHDGNKVRAAEALGMSRATIYRKIHEYGIVASGSLTPEHGGLDQTENTRAWSWAYGCSKPQKRDALVKGAK